MLVPLVALLALASPAPEAKARLLVLDFKVAGADAVLGSSITDVVSAECARDSRFDVVTSKDLRAFLDKEATRAALGCDTSSGSCLAELAGALGANLVAYGEANRLADNVLVVSINVFDAQHATALGRETISVTSDGQMPAAVHGAMSRLLRPDDVALASTLFWTGAGTAALGATVALVGVAGAGSAFAVESDRASAGTAKTAAVETHGAWTVTALAGAAVVAIGAALFGVSAAVSP